jgi:GT2 family glycosyltransferase
VSGAQPSVWAVILNWCDEARTAGCLRSLLASDYPALEILLVDNGSPDGSGERLHRAFPQLPFLQTGSNLGYTGGNNRGIRHAIAAGAEFVLVLNNDTVVEPDCVSHLVGAARGAPAVGAVGAKILYTAAPERIWYAGGEVSLARALGNHTLQGERDAPGPQKGVEEVSFVTGCCLLLPTPVVEAMGGFEEDFFAYVEDLELSLRLRSAGYRLLYQPLARLYHDVPLNDPLPSPFQIVHRDRNRRRLVRRRYPRAARVRFALYFYPTRFIRLLQYLLRGDRERARSIVEGMTLP